MKACKVCLLAFATYVSVMHAQLAIAQDDFSSMFQALSSATHYTDKVKTGFIKSSRRNKDGQRFRFAYDIPKDYSPNKAYPLIVFLHGGVNRDEWRSTEKWWTHLAHKPSSEIGLQAIVLYPSAWKEAMWWQQSQVENIKHLISYMQQRYHIDTQRVYLSGMSDGGSGSFYLSSKMAGVFAAASSVIGSPAVLYATQNKVDGEVFETNIASLPWLVINAESDRLYPADKIKKLMAHYQQFSTSIAFMAVEGGHTRHTFTKVWPRVYEFFQQHTRRALPAKINWQFEKNALFNRHSWLLVDEYCTGHERAHIQVHKKENEVHIKSRGACKIRLLISPTIFDLTRRIKVRVNQQVRFEQHVEKNIDVLQKWAARDNDPHRLFAAEVIIELTPNTTGN